MADAPPSEQPARPAATLIVAREDPAGGAPQLLMAERSAGMAFAAGAMVFPGGAVDAADAALARLHATGSDADVDDLAARIAAIRETLEETGLAFGLGSAALAMKTGLRDGKPFGALCRDLGVAPSVGDLLPFTRWCPPVARAARRYDTRFYLTVASPDHGEPEADGAETAALVWLSARDALDRAERGDARMVFPTRRNLERLAQFSSVAAMLDDARAYPPTLVSPWIERRDGEDHLCIPEGIGYPVTSQPLASVWRG